MSQARTTIGRPEPGDVEAQSAASSPISTRAPSSRERLAALYSGRSYPGLEGGCWLFDIFLGMSVSFSLVWVFCYLRFFRPEIVKCSYIGCGHDELFDGMPAHNGKMLFWYFVIFAMSRAAFLVPCVASCTGSLLRWAMNKGTISLCILRVVRDLPLCAFMQGAVVFCIHLVQTPPSEYCLKRNEHLYFTLKLTGWAHAILLTLWIPCVLVHNKLLYGRAAGIEAKKAAAREVAWAVAGLKTVQYSEALFGDEEGKSYPASCAICLASFERSEVIRVTRCKHVFHEECISRWLQTARTCAMCRQDVIRSPQSSAAAAQQAPRPGAVARRPGAAAPSSRRSSTASSSRRSSTASSGSVASTASAPPAALPQLAAPVLLAQPVAGAPRISTGSPLDPQVSPLPAVAADAGRIWASTQVSI